MNIRTSWKYRGLFCAGLLMVGCQVREAPSSGGAATPSSPSAAAVRALPGVQTGSVTLVDVWAPWDAPSCAGLGDIDRIARDYRAAGLRVVGWTLADPAGGGSGPAVSYERIVVQRDQLAPLGQIRALPTRLLMDRHGAVRHVYPGPHLPRGFEDDLKALLKDHS